MAAIVRDEFKVRALSSFISKLGTDSLYIGIGRPYVWDIDQDDDIVDQQGLYLIPENTVAGSNRDWEDMLSMKRIYQSSTSHGIFKETWTANVKYDMYRHNWEGTTPSVYSGSSNNVSMPNGLGEAKCVVVTANYSVYMCLQQRIITGMVAPSLYSPETGTAVGVNTGIVKTADGYYWKFLGATSASDIIKFSTKYYHPLTTLTAAPAPSDPYYPQWENQEWSKNFKGGIYTILVKVNGEGYNGGVAGTSNELSAKLQIVGDGTGIQYTVSYGALGSIESIEITNPGSGYTYAEVKTDVAGTPAAEFEIIFTPMRGLGVDPVKDATARYLLINTKLEEAEGGGDFTVENEYRKIVLVYNPTTFNTSTVATQGTLDATTTIMVTPGLQSTAYAADSIITGSVTGSKARVVDYNNNTGRLRVIRTSNENSIATDPSASFQVGETLASAPGDGGGVIVSITNSEVQKYSGDIIYSEYRMPILRSPDQSESLNIIVKY